jgi:RNA polymerase sigma-70 factor (ECF subfamily)
MMQHTFSNYVRSKGFIGIATHQELVEAAKSGDQEAFVEIWSHHSKRLFGMIFRIVKNREDAEDLLQEACLKSFVNIQRFDGRSQIYTWITSIAINAALMTLRRRRAKQESSMVKLTSEDGWIPLDIEDGSVDIEEGYARNERVALLWQAIRRLSPKSRTVIEMYLSRDLSIGDIAESSGASITATKSRLFRARVELNRSLRRELNGAKSISLDDSIDRGAGCISAAKPSVGATLAHAEVPDKTTQWLNGAVQIVAPPSH